LPVFPFLLFVSIEKVVTEGYFPVPLWVCGAAEQENGWVESSKSIKEA
jgi:hypothetical protein